MFVMTMTKIDIIESVYEQLDIPKKDCALIVERTESNEYT